VLALATAAAAQTGPPNPPKKKPRSARAVALLEWHKDAKGGLAPRLVPIAFLWEGKYYDAGLYEASPRPLALEPGTVYEAQRSGVPAGLFTVRGAAEVSGAWYGDGIWSAGVSESKKAAAEGDDERPRLKRAAPEGAPPAASASPGGAKAEPEPEANDPNRPTLHRGKPTEADKSSAGESPASTSAASHVGESPASTSAASHAGESPASTSAASHVSQSPASTSAASHVSQSPASTSAASHVGQPPASTSAASHVSQPPASTSAASHVGQSPASTSAASHAGQSPASTSAASHMSKPPVPTKLAEKPEPLVAVSDEQTPEPRPYLFPWNRDEEERLTGEVKALAEAEVAREAGEKLALEQVHVRAFDLYSSNLPEIVLTARTAAGKSGARGLKGQSRIYYVTVVARLTVSDDVRKLFASVTSSSWLGSVPRMEVVDAVDADGDGNGDLLFALITESGHSYALYRVGKDELFPLVETGPVPND
jgi:hypothetical protein